MRVYQYRYDPDGIAFSIAATSIRDAYLRAHEDAKIGGEVRFAEFRQRARATDIVRGCDEFDARYKLELNPYDSHAAWDGHWFETFGRELEHVAAQDAGRVWTLLEGEEHLWVAAGPHLVNRVGYLISTSRWRDPNETYVVA